MAREQAAGSVTSATDRAGGSPVSESWTPPRGLRRAAPWPSVTRDRGDPRPPGLLARAVRSMLHQSYPGDLECVVVFDQSKPADLPVDVPTGRRAAGPDQRPAPRGWRAPVTPASLAATARLSRSAMTTMTWTADKLRLQVEQLERSAAEFVASGVRIHHATGSSSGCRPAQVGLQQLVRERVTALHPSTFVMRRAALAEMGLVDEQIPGSYGEDYDWLLRAAQADADRLGAAAARRRVLARAVVLR